ncbi:MAG: S8 family serine peptidase [Planctomycetota bacterium]|jgi:hypothetical protein
MSINKTTFCLAAIILYSHCAFSASPLSDPEFRQQRIDTLTQTAQQQKARATETANVRGFPVRWQVGHTISELMRIDLDRVWVYKTHNVNAAISVAVTDLYSAPYSLDGFDQLIGLWDGGNVRSTHQEYSGRVFNQESATNSEHASHVCGTLIASGVQSSAKGMSPAATVDSYEFNNDLAEMTSRAMTIPGEAGTIQISNHSYGFATGWEYGTNPPRWYGTWGNLEADTFGQYNSDAREWDQLCYDAPYYLPFKSAGNDRNDSTPSQGAQFQYWQSGFPFGSWVNESYDSAIHPKADGWDQGGYDTISAVEIAKNIMTVGAVNDAVTSGQRDPSKATMSSFSCWGPSDDGRIKPDIVANGVGLYSSLSSTNSSYASYSGTSMSSPNACGAAALLLQQHADLFGGQFMRASTLKGLIIHTTDDLGTAGPDYRNGFGLMNTQAAADLMMGAANYPNKDILIEDTVTTSQTIRTYQIEYDGSGPIKATLCWTDPPGAAQTGLDNTTRILVNDLDLRIIHPNSITIYEPFVLDPLNPTAAATTGDNNLDNVEQVEIALTNGIQDFSLVTTGNSLVATSPVAMDVNEITQPDTPVIITLDATDDGLPNPPSALSYQITSLPNQGTLADPNDPNLPITSVPYALSSDQVIYTPRSGCDAQATFTYIASDGGTSPDGGDSNGATVAVNFEMFVTLYSATMDTDPNWTTEGDWAWGAPNGSGGSRGNPDPASGYSGGNVIGYNLNGDYSRSLSPTQWAVTDAIDCHEITGVELSFYRWLNVDSFGKDQAVIEISADRSNWTRIWQNDNKVTDSNWSLQTFDLSSVADNQATVYIRWGMGPTNNNHNYSGWNIDDVMLTGYTAPSPVILGDFEPDCDVDFDDLATLVFYWLVTCGECEGADLINDGVVNLEDFQVLANNWLAGL